MQELNIAGVVNCFEPLKSRESVTDVRRGDTFVFRIQDNKCPVGGIWIVPESQEGSLHRRAWMEIVQCYKSRQIIRGRVLNVLYRGYAVGVAGYVAFMPLTASDPHKAKQFGNLQEFVILNLDEWAQKFSVAHVNMEDQYQAELS